MIIVRYNLRVIPRTKALFDQIMHTASPLKKFWYDCLHEGTLLDNEWKSELSTKRYYDAYLEFAKKCNMHGYRLTCGQFGKEIRNLCPGIKKARRRIGDSQREWILEMPSLKSCRAEFEKMVGLTADDCGWNYIDDPEPERLGHNHADMFLNWSVGGPSDLGL